MKTFLILCSSIFHWYIHTCVKDFVVAKLNKCLAIISPSDFEVIVLLPSRKFISPESANDFISVKHKPKNF